MCGEDRTLLPKVTTDGHTCDLLHRSSELTVSGLETVRLLNGLDVDADDVEEKNNWVNLLVGVLRSPMGFENLSSHYWRLLDRLASTTLVVGNFSSRDMEVMKLLEEAEDWAKLEA